MWLRIWTTWSSPDGRRKNTCRISSRSSLHRTSMAWNCGSISEFFRQQVTYLGHVISADGLKPSEERVDAIVKIPTPENVKQLESFIGKLNYYGKFLPSFSTTCAPQNRLRRQDVEWNWSAECDQAFSQLNEMLAQKTRLVHYDPTRPITLAADASSYGIGAVISRCAPDGTEELIAFASKNADLNRVELQPGGEGDTVNHLWCEEIPPILELTPLPAHHWSQTSPGHIQSREEFTSDDTNATAAMGADNDGLRLPHHLQKVCWSRQCRCSVSPANRLRSKFRQTGKHGRKWQWSEHDSS